MITPQTITLEQLVLDRAAGAIDEFWNVLTDDYFTGEMIPGSRRVPLDQIGREVSGSGMSQDTPVVVYCSGEGCPQSAAAGEKLASLGFTNVRVFEGGLDAWKAAGRGLEMLPQSTAA